jgi:hypothetical protein
MSEKVIESEGGITRKAKWSEIMGNWQYAIMISNSKFSGVFVWKCSAGTRKKEHRRCAER